MRRITRTFPSTKPPRPIQDRKNIAKVVAMEACSSAHHWGRALIELGHEVRLLPPAHVKPYVRRNKNDPVGAAAICEAMGRRGATMDQRQWINFIYSDVFRAEHVVRPQP
jgi:transposase